MSIITKLSLLKEIKKTITQLLESRLCKPNKSKVDRATSPTEKHNLWKQISTNLVSAVRIMNTV